MGTGIFFLFILRRKNMIASYISRQRDAYFGLKIMKLDLESRVKNLLNSLTLVIDNSTCVLSFHRFLFTPGLFKDKGEKQFYF